MASWRAAQAIWYVGIPSLSPSKTCSQLSGPIVRINPNDVHINDPEFIDEVFAGGTKKRDKNKIIVRMFGLPESTVSTLPHDLHRMRRGALNPFFSKQSIRRLEPIIQNVLQKLLGILDDFRKEQKPTPMSLIFKAVTSDIISEYAFGESGNCLGMKNFNEGYFKAIGDQFLMIHAFTHIPWLNPLLQSLPDCVTAWLNPVMASFYKVQDVSDWLNVLQGTWQTNYSQ